MSANQPRPDLPGRPLLDWPERAAAPEQPVAWHETFDADALVLADIIREASNREELATRDSLYAAFQERLRAVPESARGRDGPEAENAPHPAGPRTVSRRDFLNTVLRLRHQKLAGEDEAHEFSLDAGRNDPENEEPDAVFVLQPRDIEPDYFDALLPITLAANEDLAVLRGLDGNSYYHCKLLLSATYAEILSGKDNPLLLMTQTVRSNSRDYPRPFALDMFEYPPFLLSPEQIRTCLGILAEREDTRDIGFVETSVGTVYLYSSEYMDEEYAAFLAENMDLGMISSP